MTTDPAWADKDQSGPYEGGQPPTFEQTMASTPSAMPPADPRDEEIARLKAQLGGQRQEPADPRDAEIARLKADLEAARAGTPAGGGGKPVLHPFYLQLANGKTVEHEGAIPTHVHEAGADKPVPVVAAWER